jgi:hypothetical protein
MRSTILAAALVAFSASLAYADDVMATRYGNTTIATEANGTQTKLYYKADGTFTGNQGELAFSGTWKLDGDKICLHFDKAVPGYAEPFCPGIEPHKVGDTWTAAGRKVMLVKGVQ